MAQQTGSISFEAVGGFSSYASGEYAAKETAAALQTAIEQNAEAITLRAQEIERSMTFVPLKHGREDVWFWYSLPATQWTLLDDGWAHYEYTNSGTSEVSTYIAPKSWGQVIPGEEYTFLIEIKNYSGFSGTGQFMYMQEMAGAQFWGNAVVKANGVVQSTRISYNDIVDGAFTKRFVKLADVDHIGDGTTYDNMCFRYRMYIKPNTTLSIDMRISVYPGDYAGPYNEYLTAASSAQLKVANDQIDLRVEKSGVIAAINASTEAEGGSAVKISADKVQIDGTAVFTAIEDQLDAAYDTKGAAATVQGNLDSLQVGGRNLVCDTEWRDVSNRWNVWGSPTTREIVVINGKRWLHLVTTTALFQGYQQNPFRRGKSNPANEIAPGDTLTVSCTAYAAIAARWGVIGFHLNNASSIVYQKWIYFDVTTTPQRFSASFTVPDNTDIDQFNIMIGDNSTTAHEVWISEVKLEKGNRATDWTPAPEDQIAYVDNSVSSIQIGGRNLLRDSIFTAALGTYWVVDGLTASISNSSLVINGASASGSKRIHQGLDYFKHEAGIDYTVSCDIVSTAACKISFGRRYSTVDEGGVTFDVTTTKKRVSGTYQTIAAAFCIGQPTNNATVTISNIKLEVGNKATDWSPAPEDIEANAVKRTQRIWYRSNSATKPTTPSAWVTKEDDGTGAWTKMHVAITSTHKYIYTCEQHELANGTVGYTAVLRDNTITVIDGGNIITHSIDANKLTVYDATIGKIKADAIDVSAIKIGDLDGASTVVSNASNGKSAYDRHTAYRGTCSTAAGTAAKVVACTGFALATGATVEVYCSTANTADVPTLNVNSTGAKAVWINGAVASASNPCKWLAGDTVTFTYDGTRFRASLPVEGYVTEGTGGGLMVHRKSDATTGVKITDSVDVMRNGNVMTRVDENGMTLYDGSGTQDANVVASFGEDLIELGKGSEDAVIKLCDDTGQIRLNRLTSTNAWLEFVSNYWLSLSASKSSIGLGDDYVYPSSSGQIRYMGNVHLESRNDDDSRAADIWMNGGGDTQTSSIDMQADRINLSGTVYADDINLSGTVHADGNIIVLGYLTLTTPLADDYIDSVSASKLDGTINSARLPTVPVDKGGTGQTGVEKTTDVAAAMSAASGVTISAAQVATWGKVMQVLITAKATAAKSGTWTVGTMTAGHRPELVTFGTSNLAAIEQCRMGTDGAVSVAGTLAANASVSLTFTYLLA